MGKKSKGEDKLGKLVDEYQKTKSQLLLLEICKKSENLIYAVMRYYFMQYFPSTIQDEVVEDGKSLVLLRAIEGFDITKSRFSTYYTWKLKSHIRGKKKVLMKRKEILEAKRLDAPLIGSEAITYGSNLSNFNKNVKVCIKRHIENATLYN